MSIASEVPGLLTTPMNCIAITNTNTKTQKYCNIQYQYLIKKVLLPISITNTNTLYRVVMIFLSLGLMNQLYSL